MNLTIGYIPYLNMSPFHFGFGPRPMKIAGHQLTFRSVSPASLGIEAAKGSIDAGAMSLVDTFRLSSEFEPLGNFGIGVRRAANSVFLFSKVPLDQLKGDCGVTDETATSLRLLKVLLEYRYNNRNVRFGRISSVRLIDDSLESVLLIGDEALQAGKEGLPGFPIKTDLAEEWFEWQSNPFAFARWMVRRKVSIEIKNLLSGYLERSLKETETNIIMLATEEALASRLSADEIQAYWEGFVYRLTPAHERSVRRFEELSAKCLTV